MCGCMRVRMGAGVHVRLITLSHLCPRLAYRLANEYWPASLFNTSRRTSLLRNRPSSVGVFESALHRDIEGYGVIQSNSAAGSTHTRTCGIVRHKHLEHVVNAIQWQRVKVL